MKVPNPFTIVKKIFTPPKGKSERTTFSLGNRPIYGEEPPHPSEQSSSKKRKDAVPLSKYTKENVKMLKDAFHVPGSSDVVFRDVTCSVPRVKVTIAYIEGLASSDKILTSILQPIMLLSAVRRGVERNPVDQLRNALLANGQVQVKETLEELVLSMIAGDTVVFIDGHRRALVVETKGWEHRGVSLAVSERIVRGPQQGFVEVMRTNTALVRSILATPDLVVENVDLGVRARNKCALLYVEGIVNPKIVREVRRRLHGIETAEILTSGTLEQYLEVSHNLLPTALSTERPDRVAHFLMMGACAIIVNGDPFALVVPVTFWTFLHSPEDNYVRWPYGNLLRLIRVIALFIVLYMPGIYVSVLSYHPELIPTVLIRSIAASREPIPFPLWVEVVIIFLGFELIREAGIRIPSPIGPTIGIVGALLIGEAAVAASVVSPILVIVVAITAVASFTIPSQELAMFTRLATLVFIFVGSTMGLLGIVALTYMMLVQAFSMSSLGVPYFSPFTPHRPGYAFGVPVIPPLQSGVRPAEARPMDIIRQPKESRLWDKGQVLPESKRFTWSSKGGTDDENSDSESAGQSGSGEDAEPGSGEQGNGEHGNAEKDISESASPETERQGGCENGKPSSDGGTSKNPAR